MTDTAQTVDILGVRIHDVTYEEALARIETFIASGHPHQLVTVNPEFVMLAQQNETFRQVINQAALALPDGIGILWAARTVGHPLRERVTGVDTLQRVAALAARKGYRLFLLGAAPGVADRAACRLQSAYPGLVVAGTWAGTPAESEADDIIRRVRSTRPHALFVAYGAPKQDLWIARHRLALAVPVIIGVGGAFDFIAGVTRRAPRWMRKVGLEWLHRLCQQPWRWHRMTALPQFAALVLWDKFVALREMGGR
jgi:N-acetylglucosaminyldiphosphoundecaprenol N-acetyl-beta-D-mannosaminyltransferase